MALQIRRGTELELSTFTPAEGELIFDKTNKKVYVGDGQTVGGLDVSIAGGIGGPLSSSINLNTYGIVGNGDINITGQVAVSGTISGDFDGSLVGNVIGDLVGDVYGNLFGGSIIGSDSSVLVDSITNKITGDLTGNIVGINGGTVLDNTLQTPVFYGTVSGDVIGNLYGSIIGADSRLLVDINSSKIVGKIDTDEIVVNGTVVVNGTSTNLVAIDIITNSVDEGVLIRGPADGAFAGPYITFSSFANGTTYDQLVGVSVGDSLGQIRFATEFGNPNQNAPSSIITSVLESVGDNVTTFNRSDIRLICANGGNPANAFIARLSQDIGFTAPAITPGIYADDTARDAFLTAPQAGMMVFNTALQKFQGYVSDTGLAGGGPSNATPGWINLH